MFCLSCSVELEFIFSLLSGLVTGRRWLHCEPRRADYKAVTVASMMEKAKASGKNSFKIRKHSSQNSFLQEPPNARPGSHNFFTSHHWPLQSQGNCGPLQVFLFPYLHLFTSLLNSFRLLAWRYICIWPVLAQHLCLRSKQYRRSLATVSESVWASALSQPLVSMVTGRCTSLLIHRFAFGSSPVRTGTNPWLYN